MLQYHFNWKMLSAMAGVTWWNFNFRLFAGAIRSPQIIEFLMHLLRHIPGKLLIVWDGLPGHRSRATWEFIRQQHGRLWVEFLPAYAPELNPAPVVALEAARVAQPLPAELWRAQPRCPPGLAPDAPAPHPGDCLLAAGRTVPALTAHGLSHPLYISAQACAAMPGTRDCRHWANRPKSAPSTAMITTCFQP